MARVSARRAIPGIPRAPAAGRRAAPPQPLPPGPGRWRSGPTAPAPSAFRRLAAAWEAAIDAFSNYTYAGPITRSVSDAAVMLRVLASASPRDPWSGSAGKDLPLSPGLIGRDLSAIRIGWIRKTANPQLDPD